MVCSGKPVYRVQAGCRSGNASGKRAREVTEERPHGGVQASEKLAGLQRASGKTGHGMQTETRSVGCKLEAGLQERGAQAEARLLHWGVSENTDCGMQTRRRPVGCK